VKKAIEDNNVKYKAQFDNHRCNVTFEISDMVWLYSHVIVFM
jgi:hypothetical protein